MFGWSYRTPKGAQGWPPLGVSSRPPWGPTKKRRQCRLWGRVEHASSVSCPRHPDNREIAPPTQSVPALTLICLFSEILHFYFLQAFCNFFFFFAFCNFYWRIFYDVCFKTLVRVPTSVSFHHWHGLLCFLIPVGVFLALVWPATVHHILDIWVSCYRLWFLLELLMSAALSVTVPRG